ncbi:MAG TPA: right-handed parallel beta-helix repeat-containing protein [Gemmataceae bacterium]|nr:right-handed parallel beta-helix repeat-containing protein [Gemmataceae bacterium]
MRRLTLLLVAAAIHLLPATAPASDHPVRDCDGLNRAMGAVKPGDRVLLAPGEYAGNFFFRNIHGADRRPIVIAAADPDRPPRFIGPNIGLQLSGCSHVELFALDFTATKENALNIDDGGDAEKPSHHITLRNIRVRDIHRQGNVDGIKLSGVDVFLIAESTVERWGSDGSAIDMVGCHHGVITRCSFRQGGANAVQAKGGSSTVAIRKCRFEDAGERAVNIGGSSDDVVFRPPARAMPENGRYEAKDVRVEGCTFVGGEAAVACVNADGAVVRFNTIVRPQKYALRILQERTEPQFVPCRNGAFEDNVVVFRSEKWGGVNVGGGTAADTFTFARNLWYCEDRPDRSKPTLPVAEADGVAGADPQFRDAAKGDYGVKPGSPATARGAHALPESGKR